LVVDDVWRVSEGLGSGSSGRQWLGGIPNERLGGSCQYTFALSSTEITGFIHVYPESIHGYHLKKVADLLRDLCTSKIFSMDMWIGRLLWRYLFLPVLYSHWVEEVGESSMTRPHFANEDIIIRILKLIFNLSVLMVLCTY
jgi:hypothetical protein